MLTSRLLGGTSVTSLPCSRTSPFEGGSKPAIILMVVVLPHPDGPRREKNSPSAMPRVTPLTAWTTSPCERYSLTTSSSSIAFSSVIPAAVLFADVVHDVLDPGVVVQAEHRQVLAVPGVLEAAVRHLRDERDVRVDPDHA